MPAFSRRPRSDCSVGRRGGASESNRERFVQRQKSLPVRLEIRRALLGRAPRHAVRDERRQHFHPKEVEHSALYDILTFAEDPATAGLSGGVAHFGFRLVDPNDIDRAIAEVERAGGRLLRRGEFAPGLPYAYVADPDGYEIEIWFE